jgi:hypothetical protein
MFTIGQRVGMASGPLTGRMAMVIAVGAQDAAPTPDEIKNGASPDGVVFLPEGRWVAWVLPISAARAMLVPTV